MNDALRELGKEDTMLSADEKSRLNEVGYVNLGPLLSAEEAAAIRVRLDELAIAEGDSAGKDGFVEVGTIGLGSLENKDALFDVLYLHPRLLALVASFMGEDFGLSSLTSRVTLPGSGQQPLHWDTSEIYAINALWVLSPFTEDNGATRVVPGSQAKGKRPEKELSDPLAPHPDEVLLTAPVGTLFAFNARLWHSGTSNRTDTPRYMASAFFMPRGKYQGGNVDRRLSPQTRSRLSEAALYVLDHL